MKRRIAIIGSTGSVGRQTLQVAEWHRDRIGIEVLTAFDNAELLIRQATLFQPNAVVIGNPDKYPAVLEALDPLDIKVYAGTAAISQIVEMDTIDLVVVAATGFAGLRPTLAALRNHKTVALANKESVVAGGHLLKKALQEGHGQIIPIDSEHSAIFQCLAGESGNPVEQIVLIASGGPFINYAAADLEKVGPQQALAHPVWEMGPKVTIDSATLMNKGLEVIEAHWLFGLPPEKIQVLLHPQGIVHAMVYLVDGTIKTIMGLPDMRIPIQYALTFPERRASNLKRLDLLEVNSLTFAAPDTGIFRNLALAFEALKKGGNMPCILNAANEIAVEAFLDNNVKFLQIPQLIEHCMHHLPFMSNPDFGELLETDRETRIKAREWIKQR